MPLIGPHSFVVNQDKVNDLHILYRGSGGVLRNPKVVAGPKPKSITTKYNQVNITWDAEVPKGTTIGVSVESDFRFTQPDSYVFSKDGQKLGDWIPYEAPKHGDWRGKLQPVSSGAPDAADATFSPGPVEIINRDAVRSAFDRERLSRNLFWGGASREESMRIADALEPIIVAVGYSPISTIALRAAVGEAVINPQNPDAGAIRAAIVGDGGERGEIGRGLPPVIGDESGLIQAGGRFLGEIDRAAAIIAAGERPPEDMIGLYDEGVALHANAIEMAVAHKQFCLHPMTGVPIVPTPMPPLARLLELEQEIGFYPANLIKAFLAAPLATDWQAVIEEILFKALGVFGLSDFYAPILEILRSGEFEDVWEDLLEAAAKHELKHLIEILIKKFLLSDKFKEMLIKKLGKKAAEEVLKKIAEKWIPIFGWAKLIGNIIAVLIVQILFFSALVLGPLTLPE